MDTKPTIKNFLAVILPAILAVFIIFFIVMPKVRQSREVVGGDRDGHGCIPSAGYSWSEEREQCVRAWEVPVMAEAEDAVRAELAQKYGKPADSIAVKVTKIDGDYVAGSVNFAPGTGAPGGLFLAFKKDGLWRLAYDGNGSVDCGALRGQYGFSDLILAPQFCN